MTAELGDAGGLSALGSALARTTSTLDPSLRALSTAAAKLESNWNGRAAIAFAASWATDQRACDLLSAATARTATALASLGSELGTYQRRLDSVLADAAQAGVAVDGQGNRIVGLVTRTPLTAEQQVVLTGVQRDVTEVLADARTSRSSAEAALRSILAAVSAEREHRIPPGSGAGALAALERAEATGDYAAVNRLLKGMSSTELQAFFARLSPAEQQALAKADPSGVGNLDGVPLPLRALADHELAERDLTAAEARGDSATADRIHTLLDGGGSLVLYDPDHDHYGVLYGNIEAKHVALFVPGVGDDGSLNGWLGDARRLQQQAPDSAVIMWKGYDNPGDHGTLDKATAAFSGRAEDGARSLTSFVDGMGVGGGQTTTIVAHSYGSVVTGVALSQDGLHATNVVALGSPGMTVDDVGQLHLRPDQFFDEKAPGDPVANGLAGFGKDPSSPYFGGTRLATNADGDVQVSGHSGYFSAHSQSMQGMVDVMEGHVTPADVQKPSAGDWFRTPVSVIVNPAGPGLDWLTDHYHGPGSGVLQGVDHASNAIANGTGNLVGATIDKAGSVLSDLIP